MPVHDHFARGRSAALPAPGDGGAGTAVRVTPPEAGDQAFRTEGDRTGTRPESGRPP
ncbi:hypothetical protein [Streptomyces agglomeratus]|uniref:hypothetical protein n=1 Tax=Streptomyces agglomeratus TaxID=285458 RepID=UPI001428CB39|nr:hypothetical protein [Streptomyces agglomeratus]